MEGELKTKKEEKKRRQETNRDRQTVVPRYQHRQNAQDLLFFRILYPLGARRLTCQVEVWPATACCGGGNAAAVVYIHATSQLLF